MKTLDEILEKFEKKELRALSRCLSLAENRDPIATKILAKLFSVLGKARVIGITGPPGAGKSSLIAEWTRELRAQNRKVAIVAVDPMSPFSGGAILGDRIRLQSHFNDANVFIRSLSTRGKLGGLSSSTREIVHFLDAFGFDDILVETVGVGQNEFSITEIADLTALVLVPGAGDDIQIMKAGILETPDIFIANKSDREGSEKLLSELTALLEISGKSTDLVLLTTKNDFETIRKALQKIEEVHKSIFIKNRSRRLSVEKTTQSLLEELIQREVNTWLEKNLVNHKNPYEFFDNITPDFLKKFRGQ